MGVTGERRKEQSVVVIHISAFREAQEVRLITSTPWSRRIVQGTNVFENISPRK
ncbi:hypothetical protein [Spirochaeta thermophila]|uniref:hypothetical protein n=1 Tax=Winmispira thermophila TaxID=154 RepID=UPI0001F0E2C9|nr:hypothetical protein [Spirochaeta thermophila]